MNIQEIKDPFERYIAFLIERNKIYHRKTAGEPWPWTTDPILQAYRFTEVYRERDRTSLHYQKTIRNFYGATPLVLPGTVLYRWYNRISTCDGLFNEPDVITNRSVFEMYMDHNCYRPEILFNCIKKLPTPHVTGAFIINGAQGYSKGMGVAVHFHEWCEKPWQKQWETWLQSPPTLQEMYDWLKTGATGLGSFMTAQIIADLKYLPFMQNVPDWWTWAAPGPGSMRGLNVVHGRDLNAKWNEADWLECIQELRKAENERLADYGLGPFHAQDTQNHCCEYSKYTKVMMGLGRPRQVYQHV
jgi:hypothetical protein